MKIAITGCNGSVGRRVVLLALERGHTIIGIDLFPSFEANEDRQALPRFSFIQADLLDYETAKTVLTGCEGIIHLAAIREPTDYLVKTHNTNVVLSWNVLRAAAELSINRIALASSVNVVTMAFSKTNIFHYFPLDEDHPCEPDEPYGLSKVISELQAETIVRRHPSMRIASLRLSWSVPSIDLPSKRDPAGAAKDLWGYVHEDSAAESFLLALSEDVSWKGHEPFFIAAPQTAELNIDSDVLRKQYYADVPTKEGKGELRGRTGFFDCSKAARILGWIHRDSLST